MADEENCCSVCRAKRRELNHLRIGVCRACDVFFRRANHNGAVLKCRTGTGDCKLDRDSLWPCKKCRYEKIRRSFNQLLRERPRQPSPRNALEYNYEPMSDRENVIYYLDEIHLLNISPMLRKFRKCYNELCRERLAIEFGTLKWLPLEFMVEAEQPVHTADFNYFLRRLSYAILNFLNTASEEFAVMKPEYKMKLFGNFVKVWITFEGIYRTLKYFPGHENRIMATFGRYIEISDYASFYPIFTNNRFKDEAFRMLQEAANKRYSISRSVMTRLNLSDEEYVAITAILLWNITGKSVSDDLSDVAEKNKMTVLHDLYKYYRSVGLKDYSARLGEILAFLQLLERQIDEATRLVDTFRVLGVVDEESYNLLKTMEA